MVLGDPVKGSFIPKGVTTHKRKVPFSSRLQLTLLGWKSPEASTNMAQDRIVSPMLLVYTFRAGWPVILRQHPQATLAHCTPQL